MASSLRTVSWLLVVSLYNVVPFGTGSFNSTLVVLNSQGSVSSITTITKEVMQANQNGTLKTKVPLVTNQTSLSTAATGSVVSIKPKAAPKAPANCGIPTIATRMDSVAQFKEWPWHVAIVEAKNDLYICGGSLISASKILTGAHCLEPYATGRTIVPGGVAPLPRLKVRAGEWDVSTNSEALPHVEVLVHKMTLHWDFDNETLQNDLAIIHLAKPILPEFRENILPVCLPKVPKASDSHRTSALKRCIVTGWGRINETSGHSIVLKEIVVPLWENDRCERQLWKHFGRTFVLPKTAICAGDEDNDACDGDGGGGLICFEDGRWVQEGIVSFGIGCGRSDSPGVYTRVASYLKFIQDEMQEY